MKIYISIFAVLVLMMGAGCTDNVRPDDEDHSYLFSGAIVKDIAANSSFVTVELSRDSVELFENATIHFNGTAVPFIVNQDFYGLSFTSAGAIQSGENSLRIKDDTFIDYVLTDTVPTNLAFSTSSLPENRVNPGGSSVQYTWQISLNSDGYILGAVMKDSTYMNGGWSEFVEGVILPTSANLPPDAFRLSGDLDTGWYYIYVYSFAGSPMPMQNLPTKLPTGFLQNIDELKIDGHFGSFIVSPPESVHVTIQP